MEMTTISFDEAALQQAIINGAIQRLCKDPNFREEAAKAVATHAYSDACTFKSDFRAAAKAKLDEQLEEYDKGIKAVAESAAARAKKALEDKYATAIRNYTHTSLSKEEIRKIALHAVESTVRKAFGRRAKQMADAVVGQTDRLQMLLEDELGEREVA